MKPQVIKSSTINKQNFGAIEVQELLSSHESKNMSVAIVELFGVNERAKNRISDMFYFIIEGNGMFNIDDKEYKVGKGDLVMIPKNIFYFDSGEMKMLSFSSPRFDAANIEHSK